MAKGKEPRGNGNGAGNSNGNGDAGGPAGESVEEIARELRAELDAARQELRAARAEFREISDELRGANEELRAINLQYRSKAQQLLASNEELQSINRQYRAKSQELTAANEELRSINEGLQKLNSGLSAKLEAAAKAGEAAAAGEARLRLLLSELSHRVKNMLAVVQSMARQSLRAGVSREEGLERFSARLRAFAEVHNLLAGNDWRGAGLRELASRQIEPYKRAGGKAIELEGPAVSLPPDIATPFGLVLHELAANALKYGALSSPAGSLRLQWAFRGDGPEKEFRFTWREAGGPTPALSSKEGFGTWLIRNGLPEARVALEFPEDGAICTIAMPARNVVAD